jgi:hypothetical protein
MHCPSADADQKTASRIAGCSVLGIFVALTGQRAAGWFERGKMAHIRPMRAYSVRSAQPAAYRRRTSLTAVLNSAQVAATGRMNEVQFTVSTLSHTFKA